MPDVVSDTSVIQYLFQVGLLDLLFTLYPEITIPEAVAKELAEGQNHRIELPNAEAMSRFRVLKVAVPQSIKSLKSLGSGEQAVLSLALASPDVLVLLDDAVARQQRARPGFAIHRNAWNSTESKTIGSAD